MLVIFSSINRIYTYSFMGGIFMNENSMNNFLEERENKKYFNIIKGIGIAFIITLLGIFVFSLLLTYTKISENTISPVIIIISAISILIGANISTRKLNKNGMLNGALIGGIYILLIYLISSIINSQFSINIYSIFLIIFGIIAGLIGGILGINS